MAKLTQVVATFDDGKSVVLEDSVIVVVKSEQAIEWDYIGMGADDILEAFEAVYAVEIDGEHDYEEVEHFGS